ncbi:MAG: ribose-5-phosphate isomerase RpiA [Candidatus Hadarchaeota archaeon]|nr:ribose-5-phosphate isomerase RpiA [Candidatus Hadarchaeota archaeon]
MRQEWKRAAAEEAAKLVREGMSVGLGSGSTLAEVVRALSGRRTGATFVASSSPIQRLATRLGLCFTSLDDHPNLDLVLDGADEVAPDFSMIKGGGGAHTREKMVASAAKKVAIVVDRTKLVPRLGERNPVPVEVLPFAWGFTAGRLAGLGGEPELRTSPSGSPFVTDDGNYIIDLKFRSIDDPAKLERTINQVPGVIENGLFVGVADTVFVGYEGGCVRLRSKEDFLRFMRG